MKADTQVVITGTGLACSLGKDTAETWNALLSGKSGVKPIQGFDVSDFGCRVAAQVEGLTPNSLGIHPRDARIMDVHSLLLLMAGREAFRKAHPVHSGMLGEEMGFFAGMGMIDYKIDDLMPCCPEVSRSGWQYRLSCFLRWRISGDTPSLAACDA